MAFHGIDKALDGEKVGDSRYEIEGYLVWKMSKNKWRARKADEEFTVESFSAAQRTIRERVGK